MLRSVQQAQKGFHKVNNESEINVQRDMASVQCGVAGDECGA